MKGSARPDVLKVYQAYKDFIADITPLITNIEISTHVPLVELAYGTVQESGPISYRHPVPLSQIIVHHQDIHTPAALPSDEYRLDPTTCTFVCSHQQQNQLQSFAITLDIARKVEVATRDQIKFVHLAGEKVIYKEALVHHDCHVRLTECLLRF